MNTNYGSASRPVPLRRFVPLAADDFTTIPSNFDSESIRILQFNILADGLSGLRGDNVVTTSQNMQWYRNETLLATLEKIATSKQKHVENKLRLSVQRVARDKSGKRYYQGRVISGKISKGDAVNIIPGNFQTTVQEILSYQKKLKSAYTGQAISLALKNEVDYVRGDIISDALDKPEVSPYSKQRLYGWKRKTYTWNAILYAHCTTSNVGYISSKYKIDINTLIKNADTLSINEIGLVKLTTDHPIVFEPYRKSRAWRVHYC